MYKEGKRALDFERLENRFALNGLTIITHGHLLEGQPNIPNWVSSMAQEIAKYTAQKYGGNPEEIAQFKLELNKSNKIYVSDFSYHNGFSYSNSPRNFDLENSLQGEAIISLDWSAISALYDPSTTTIANVIADYLTDPSWRLGKEMLSQPIHLIGHSRGGSLINAIAEKLGNNGVIVEQTTFLDPFPLVEDYGFFSIPIPVPNNVLFSDNYYRSWAFLSRTVQGSKEIDIKWESKVGGYVDAGFFAAEHSNPHLWYHGTIDTQGTINNGDVTFDPDEKNWYYYHNRDETGYFFRRTNRKNLPREGVNGNLPYFNGIAERKVITHNSEWDNIFVIDYPKEIYAGNNLMTTLGFLDDNSDATIVVGLDTDTNPYNGFLGNTKEFNVKDFSSNFFSTLLTTKNLGGEYYVFAKIDNGNAKFDYSKEKIIIHPEISPESVDFFSGLFNAPWDKVIPSQDIEVQYEIINQGTAKSGIFSTAWYISQDHIITQEDYMLERAGFVGLNSNTSTGYLKRDLQLPGECNSFWNKDGYYYVGQIIDEENKILEEIEFNNANRGDGIDYQRIHVINTCPPKPKLNISALDDIVISEAKTTAPISISLNTEPTSTVYVSFHATNKNEGLLSDEIITFNSSNWKNPQTITITGVHDNFADGNQNFLVQINSASVDQNYDKKNIYEIFVTNLDLGDYPYRNPVRPLDIDSNNIINPSDAIRILSYLRNPIKDENTLLALDVSNDNKITPFDALQIIRYLSIKFQEAESEAIYFENPTKNKLIDRVIQEEYLWLENRNMKITSQK